MSGPRTGDLGQRYEVRYEERDGIQRVLGWTEDVDVALRMREGWSKHPSVSTCVVVDRGVNAVTSTVVHPAPVARGTEGSLAERDYAALLIRVARRTRDHRDPRIAELHGQCNHLLAKHRTLSVLR